MSVCVKYPAVDMDETLYNLSAYQYELPEELIAQEPCTPRDAARLMVVDRSSQTIEEMSFRDLADMLAAGDSLVLNDTKVIPARLYGRRPSGGKVELLLLRQLRPDVWEVLARPGKKLLPGTQVAISEQLSATVEEALPDGKRIVSFTYQGEFTELLSEVGEMPLPPYIRRPESRGEDKERYQTVFAAHPGAVAAPTAGLHFTPELLAHLSDKGVDQVHVTLHVGLGTFQPVQRGDIREHTMHTESFTVSEKAAHALNNRMPGKRQICVGTTCCRVLESALREGKVCPGSFDTQIFIYPGYKFQYVQHLLTNFHLPGSTLLMLVSAFAGHELMREAYRKAVKDRFRFFSYGDAMLIL